LVSFWISLLICCKMSRTHIFIITWFDKPYKLWYKFCWGKVFRVRNVLVWGFFGLDRNVFWK
jgi:hypothetical protein